MGEDRRGLLAGISAYLLWGTLPIYLKALKHVPPWDVVAYRVLWSIGLCLIALAAVGRLGELIRVLKDKRRMLLLAGSSALIAANWLIYIMAIVSDHVLQASLGYYINPLLNVLLGVLLLREHLPLSGRIAVALATVGVAILTWQTGAVPWLALGLACSFAGYGLIRKHVAVDALTGLSVETLLLAPVAFVWIWFWGSVNILADWKTNLLLIGAGPMTAVPLMLFAFAARRLPFSTIGLLQFIAPTMMFLFGVFLYHEPLGWPQVLAFSAIWAGLAIYVSDSIRQSRRRALAQAVRLR